MHKEWDTVIPWQAVYHPVDFLAVVAVLGNVILEFTRLVDVEKIVGVIDERLVTHLFAVVVYKDVPHYGIYPAFKVRVGGIFVHIAQCLQRRLLQQVVRLLFVCCQLVREAL